MTTTIAPATPPTPAAPVAPVPDKAKLLEALRRCGIEASPRTLNTWMETAENLCLALATHYRAAEPQATRTIAALEESASEFALFNE